MCRVFFSLFGFSILNGEVARCCNMYRSLEFMINVTDDYDDGDNDDDDDGDGDDDDDND